MKRSPVLGLFGVLVVAAALPGVEIRDIHWTLRPDFRRFIERRVFSRDR